LPATAFINFLQNHDQIGNRADARRLANLTDAAPLRALTALTLLAPAIPMLFMGEEWASRRRFDFFVDFAGDLAAAVRKGRQDEFAQMRHAEPGGEEAAHIDPNAADIYRQSQLDWDERVEPRSLSHLTLVKRLLTLRHTHIVPRLANLRPGGTFEVRDGRALRVRWALADGALALVANLSPEPIANLGWRVEGTDIFATEGFQSADAIDALPPWSVCVRITSP
jgi:1,4-alpha-glucan branching enzyme